MSGGKILARLLERRSTGCLSTTSALYELVKNHDRPGNVWAKAQVALRSPAMNQGSQVIRHLMSCTIEV